MNIFKRIGALLLCAVMLATLFSVNAFAAGSIDTDKAVSLTLSYKSGEKSLSEAKFSLYLVASVDEFGNFTVTEQFKKYNVNIDIKGKNDEEWRKVASTLEGYILRDKLTPADSGKTDKNGELTFPTKEEIKLYPGLYIVVGERHRQEIYLYDAASFMVMLPTEDLTQNVWNYDVKVNVKLDYEKEWKEDDTTSLKVLKVWKDSGFETKRPKEISVQLLRNGKAYETVKLNAKNNWRYTWNNLDDNYNWTVVEKEQNGYIVTTVKEGITFVITNTYPGGGTTPEKPVKPNLPQTGQLWWPVPVMFSVGLLFVVIGLVLKRGEADEK